MMTPQERFWTKVKIGGPDECWEWMAGRDKDGYGLIQVRGKQLKAHRFCYEITYGEAPGKSLVIHSCDNPPCCNPAHLRKGTPLSNMADCVARGRIARGERSGRHTHPERTARGDRSGSRLHPEAYPRGEQHPSHLHPERFRGERNPSAILTLAQVEEARLLHGQGISYCELGRRYGVWDTTIRYAVIGETWRL